MSTYRFVHPFFSNRTDPGMKIDSFGATDRLGIRRFRAEQRISSRSSFDAKGGRGAAAGGCCHQCKDGTCPPTGGHGTRGYTSAEGGMDRRPTTVHTCLAQRLHVQSICPTGINWLVLKLVRSEVWIDQRWVYRVLSVIAVPLVKSG